MFRLVLYYTEQNINMPTTTFTKKFETWVGKEIKLYELIWYLLGFYCPNYKKENYLNRYNMSQRIGVLVDLYKEKFNVSAYRDQPVLRDSDIKFLYSVLLDRMELIKTGRWILYYIPMGTMVYEMLELDTDGAALDKDLEKELGRPFILYLPPGHDIVACVPNEPRWDSAGLSPRTLHASCFSTRVITDVRRWFCATTAFNLLED